MTKVSRTKCSLTKLYLSMVIFLSSILSLLRIFLITNLIYLINLYGNNLHKKSSVSHLRLLFYFCQKIFFFFFLYKNL
jgi:hypothetical protein